MSTSLICCHRSVSSFQNCMFTVQLSLNNMSWQNEHIPLPPKTPKLSRKAQPTIERSRRSVSRLSSSCSELLSSLHLDQILDPDLCDSCACQECDNEEEDTRFMVSMVAHQLPSLDHPDDDPDMLLASMVTHMVCKLLGDEDKLREAYMSYVEGFIHGDESCQYNFLPSFLSHCLPLLDPVSDPALCHLITTLVSHTAAFPDLDEDIHDIPYTHEHSEPSTATRYLFGFSF